MRIGVTDTLKPSLTYYTDWLNRIDTGIEFTVLSHARQNIESVDSLDGLFLTGGGDVDPRYFGVEDVLGQAKEINGSRDEFEFFAIERALDRSLPILGICRGIQVMNVYLGGSLILDLLSAGYNDHARDDKYRIAHEVVIEPQSLLHHIVCADALAVNSSHHQAIGRLGNGLMVSATSADGVIEAAEWIMKDRMPFLLLVQWHPERMEEEFESPASKAVAEKFLEDVRLSTTNKASDTAKHLIEK